MLELGQVEWKVARDALTSQEGKDAAYLSRQILTLKTDLQHQALKYAAGPLASFLRRYTGAEIALMHFQLMVWSTR